MGAFKGRGGACNLQSCPQAFLLGAPMIRTPIAVTIVFLTAAMMPTISCAAEIKLLAAAALEQVLSELLPQFEKDTGHRISVIYGPIGALTGRIKKGEATDVAIVSDQQVEELQISGEIVAGTRVDVARTGVGVFMRKDSQKPDIGTVDAFKRTLLAARTVTYADPASGGAGGIYVARLIERMGISAEMNRKTKLDSSGGYRLYQMVANGEAELGFDQMSIILTKPAVDFIGPLPEPIQRYTTFAAGVGATSDETETARAFIDFLHSPAAQRRFRASGLL
jgi:molybdate transport system substrate-binding protein